MSETLVDRRRALLRVSGRNRIDAQGSGIADRVRDIGLQGIRGSNDLSARSTGSSAIREALIALRQVSNAAGKADERQKDGGKAALIVLINVSPTWEVRQRPSRFQAAALLLSLSELSPNCLLIARGLQSDEEFSCRALR